MTGGLIGADLYPTPSEISSSKSTIKIVLEWGIAEAAASRWLRGSMNGYRGALGFSADELADILAAAGGAVYDGDAPEALSAASPGGGAVRQARRMRRSRRRTPPMPIRSRGAKPSSALAICGCSASNACSLVTALTSPSWRACLVITARRCFSPARPTTTSAPTPPAASRIGMR